ncbi:hypothetical protein ASPVEDRAFT_25350 [Aspergillus versicolor CBS 583.65]|uniref:Response regulatory domain-containing protein n=1 Tax=Aspergillus versicolor CBS 583.65 TaxID=1036611 RepID=A0A1L9PAF3_ASPVE|nr:uncharacterized protein ASPVEDRAFT_25350 [Aspergillus versicolor CBS 583.65]OJI98476.1 hypothetical protein ASPVEDRAFT_25350 [Aspergillus versicolor CBS 583.65]
MAYAATATLLRDGQSQLMGLIPDSYPTIRLTAKVLQGLNCAVTGFTNGRDALAYLADRNNPRPHLIFIKIKGLGYTPDGHEVAQILRTQAPFIQDPVLQSTPIIGLTAMGQLLPENLKFMNDMLHKPMKVRDIRWVFITWMRRDPWQPHPKI